MTRDEETGMPEPKTRIQRQNFEAILEAALEVFSAQGFRGATIDEIAKAAGLNKPNLLYYFPSKAAMHQTLVSKQLNTWLEPLEGIDPDGEPVEEILSYLRLKLSMAQKYPRESRLFANEILQGAPGILDVIKGPLRDLVEEKAQVIAIWRDAGRICVAEPRHLIFSIWATTQHYADFDVQVRGILAEKNAKTFADAERFLTDFYRRALTPA